MAVTFNDLKAIFKLFIADLKEGLIPIGYKNDNYPSVTTVNAAIDDIYNTINYVAPSITSFSMTPNTTNYEKGTVVSGLTFKWATNKAVTSQSLTGCTLANASVREATYSSDISADKTFTLSVSDGKKSASKSLSIKFLNKKYWGAAAIPSEYNSDFVLSLSNSSLVSGRTGNVTADAGADKYIYFCIPTTFGEPTCTIGGFETVLEKAATINFVNAHGYALSYNIYKTSQPNLGNTTLVIS